MLDPVATSRTVFRQGVRPAPAKSSDYSLPLKACYIDTRFFTSDSPEISSLQLVWNPGGGNFFISYDADRKKALIELDARTDIEYVDVKSCGFRSFFSPTDFLFKHAEQHPSSEAYDGTSVIRFALQPGLRKSVRDPDPTSVSGTSSAASRLFFFDTPRSYRPIQVHYDQTRCKRQNPVF